MKTKIIVMIAALLLACCSGLCQNNKVDWCSFSTGFNMVQSANTMVTSVVGQGMVGTMQAGNTQIVSGFLGNPVILGPVTGISDHNIQSLPTSYGLQQNYPNPFNPATIIEYQLPAESRVTLKIFNILGQVVTTLKDEIEQAGYRHAEWNAGNFASGVYFYRLEAVSLSHPDKTFTQARKLVVMK
jgi:hypothetical protein